MLTGQSGGPTPQPSTQQDDELSLVNTTHEKEKFSRVRNRNATHEVEGYHYLVSDTDHLLDSFHPICKRLDVMTRNYITNTLKSVGERVWKGLRVVAFGALVASGVVLLMVGAIRLLTLLP